MAPVEAAARARAAIAYSGLSREDVAERSGLALALLSNITSRTRPSGGTLDRLFLVADACGVPRSFMERGWGAVEKAHERRD